MHDPVPFCILKKLAVIRELQYFYSISEDGDGVAEIDGFRLEFFVNEYGEIDLDSVRVVV